VTNLKIPLPLHVNFIITTLESANYEAYIVGGCVRDIIRGAQPKDWDIATSATPEQAKALFERTVDTGIKHGTITVLLDSQPYEVTTFRVDGKYLDNRRPETVWFSTNIEEDLSRRDFTMNAIAYNPHKGFADPFGGRDDIRRGIIRCVGNPVHRFGEDALRMLRAIRFAAATGFRIDAKILEAISALNHHLQHISPERMREEFGKLIISPHVEVMELLQSTGLLQFMLFGVTYRGDLAEIIPWLKKCPPIEAMGLALFLHWTCSKECELILRNLRYDNKTMKEVLIYLKYLSAIENLLCDTKAQSNTYTGTICNRIPVNDARAYGVKKILRHVSQAHFENLITLKTIITPNHLHSLEEILKMSRDIQQKGECFTLRSLAINGTDLKNAGITKGEEIGNILETLLDIVMRDPNLNKKDELFARVLNLK